MSDLRTRIAAALYKAVSENCDGYVADIIAAGQPIDPLKDEVLVDGLLELPELADAVIRELIRELGLRMNVEHRVAHYILTPPRGFLRKFDSRFRWVTGWSDWIADEESARPE